MRFSIPLTFAAVAVLGFSGVAAASAKDMSDGTYIAIAQCAGVAEGTGGDVAPFDAALKAQSDTRLGEVMDRADEARADARRNASHAGEDGKASFVRERDGVCQSYLSRG